MRWLPLGALVAGGLCAFGCGAKTGLPVPSLDAAVDGEAPPICVEVGYEADPIEVDLRVQAEIGRADVAFLIDTTGSMADEIDVVRARLRDVLVPAIDEALPDAELAVATFADFPVPPYGAPGDSPFVLRLPRTRDVSAVQAAMDGIPLSDGGDAPEAQVEALFQLFTGAGIDGLVPPSAGCPSGGVGFACFREDALPVVLLFTDAPFHNGPGGADAYGDDMPFPAKRYGEALAEARRLGAKVIGFDSGRGRERGQLAQLAQETGAVADGTPLVYSIGPRGDGLDTSVVEAIRTLASDVRFDVDTVLRDPDPRDGYDVVGLVQQVLAVRADPPSGVASIERSEGRFVGVRAGTRLFFALLVHNDRYPPGSEPVRLRLEVRFRGDGRTYLGAETVWIVIPAQDGRGCS